MCPSKNKSIDLDILWLHGTRCRCRFGSAALLTPPQSLQAFPQEVTSSLCHTDTETVHGPASLCSPNSMAMMHFTRDQTEIKNSNSPLIRQFRVSMTEWGPWLHFWVGFLLLVDNNLLFGNYFRNDFYIPFILSNKRLRRACNPLGRGL